MVSSDSQQVNSYAHSLEVERALYSLRSTVEIMEGTHTLRQSPHNATTRSFHLDRTRRPRGTETKQYVGDVFQIPTRASA